ncbi:telomere length regulation protein TEL2 homolog [Ochlerotatus camptorhynchus]|uniref:telomere length regulation protein TEL2 homolog n=1 Tax=Ochlerotatus camptorhynchus TaxID=644619 RepID=UPI0031CF2415
MDKFISMWKVRELADKVTNVVMNYTEIEGKVREATNDEPWGPTGPLMQELAHATFTYEHFPEVMSMLWKRMLQDNKTNWRRTYKSLLLLNYLVRNGSERVVTSSREHIYDLRSLENYTFMDENGKDQGINVRHKVRELIDFIQDDDKLRDERKKAKKNKDKYIGMSSDAMGGMRYGGSGAGGGGGSEYGGYRDSWDRRTDERGYNEGKDRYEYDYQYDGEREDSDTESNGTHANRYYDKERSKSPATRQPSSSLSTHSASGAGSSSSAAVAEKKINLNIKSPAAAAAAVKAAAAAAAKPAKKIDMGAAKNFGKSADLGINSPTHRNTHAEEIISTSDATTSGKQQQQSNEILDDLFRTCPPAPPSEGSPAKDDFDDFNPRADDSGPSGGVTGGPEFGDFESAFGKPTPKPVSNEFADFAAFSSAPVPAPVAAASSDIFFGLNPSATSAAPATAGMNLFGMAHQQQQQPAAAANDLLSDMSGLSLGGSTNVSHHGEGLKLQESIRDLLELLQSVEKIRSEEQLNAIRSKLDVLLECLPGPRTPEQLLRLDDDQRSIDWATFASDEFPDLLEQLVERFDGQFPGKVPQVDNRIWRIFGLDYNHVFIAESLAMLTAADKLGRNREVFPFLLTRLVQDCDYLTGCFVELSLKAEDDGLTKYTRWTKSEQLIQTLTSIPNKVANVLQRETPDIFLPERLSQILLQQMLRAINSVAQITHLHNTYLTYETTFLSKLFSKLIVDYFNNDKRSHHLQLSLRILAAWAQSNGYQQKTLIAAICADLSRPAVETLARIALREGIDLFNLLRAHDFNGDWKYVLTKKIPLFSSFPQDSMVENLMYLLARVSASELKALTLELVTVWSSRTGIQKTSFEQHLYLSKQLLLAMTYLNLSKHGKLNTVEIREFRRLLFGGLKCHLESPVKELRCVGMIVSEVILGYFDAQDVDEENKLKFDYEGFDSATLQLVASLRNFKNRCRFTEDELSQSVISSEDEPLDQLVEKLFATETPEISIYSSSLSKPSEPPLTEVELLSLKSSDIKPPLRERKLSDSDDSALDSDDDLEPYDMSHDTNIDEEQLRPKYLLDLREILLDNSDQQAPVRFELAMAAAPDLIAQQLSNNDIKLALDLLQILLPLEARVYMENYQELKFSSLIAICTTYPKECAEYICREFHSDLSKYSLNRRILMLDILAQTAKVLSNLASAEPQSQQSQVNPPNPSASPPPKNALDLKFHEENELLRKRQLAERIVRERIAGKTRRFSSRPIQSASSKPPTMNRFSEVAGWFFFPLLRGFGSKQFLFTANLKFQYDADNLLLTTFLQTLSILMICAENCPIARKFGRELMNLSVMLRFSEEPKVRLSVLQVLSSIFLALPKAILRQDFYVDLVDLKQWLEECVQGSVVRGESNEECREFARNVLVMCYGALAED